MVRTIGTVQDITERKQAEAELAEKEAQLRVALTHMPAGMTLADRDFNYLAFNPQFSEICDLPDGFIKIGGSVRDTLAYQARRGDFGPGDADALADAMLGVIWKVEDKPATYVRPLADGRVLQIEVAPTPDGGYVTTFNDITERKLAEDALADSEARFRTLMDAAPDAMIIADETGEIALINAQTEALFGWTRDELVGKTVETLVPERFAAAHPAHRNAYLRDPVTRTMGETPDLAGRAKDGREFPVEISLSPIEIDGRTWVAAAVRDVTERRQAEDAIRESEEQLRLITDNLPVLIVYVDADWRYRFANETCAAWYAKPRGDIIGRRVDEVLDESSIERFRPR